MNFFCTEDEYDTYVDEQGLDRSEIFCLDIDKALEVAKMLFSVTDI